MTQIDMKAMKEKALNFPEPVRSLVLSEADQIDSQDFISKIGTWEKLLKMEVLQR
jgi:hypothetical protein